MVKHRLSLVVLVMLAGSIARAADNENPFKNVKEGDWATYQLNSSVMGAKLDGEFKIIVAAKSEMEVTLKTTSVANGIELPGGYQKVDLTKPYDPTKSVNANGTNAESEKIGDGKEKVKIGAREYDCTWVQVKNVNAGDKKSFSEVKVWICKDAPLGGIVKMEIRSEATNLTLELKDHGGK